jgi:hypothetical protein
MYRGELVAMLNLENGGEDQLEAILPISNPHDDDGVAEQIVSFIIQHINELPDVLSGVAILNVEEIGVVFEFGFSSKEDDKWTGNRLH